MTAHSGPRLTELAALAGCTGKAGAEALAGIMAMFGPGSGQAATEAGDPNLLVGLAKPDDAAVYQVSPELAVVVTVDFFAPIVDDPYAYGAIAAANALSDVYAMGGDVTIALNIAGFPAEMDSEVVAEILRGGGEKVAEAGGVIAGGHTIIDAEPKLVPVPNPISASEPAISAGGASSASVASRIAAPTTAAAVPTSTGNLRP